MSILGDIFASFNSNNNNTTKTYVNNSNQPTRYMELTCSKCGGKLNLDLDHLQAYCPYCGEKLMIDTNQLGMILAEKEETKRKQLELEHEERMEKYRTEKQEKSEKTTTLIIGVIVIISLLFICLRPIFSLSSKKTYPKEQDMKDQVARLESLVQEIKSDMDNKDYDSAMYKANQLHYTYVGWSREQESALAEKWDSIREETIKMIEEAKVRDSGASTTNAAVTFNGGGFMFSI